MPTSFSAVIRLFLRRGPSTVRRLVMAFVVDAVDRVLFGWSRSHVCVKVGERSPAVADSDAASTVSLVVMPQSVAAAAKDVIPSHILGSVALAVRGVLGFQHLALNTATRVGFAVRQIASGDSLNLATVTATHIARVFRIGRILALYNNQPSKPSARGNRRFSHMGIIPYFGLCIEG